MAPQWIREMALLDGQVDSRHRWHGIMRQNLPVVYFVGHADFACSANSKAKVKKCLEVGMRHMLHLDPSKTSMDTKRKSSLSGWLLCQYGCELGNANKQYFK